MLVDRDNIESTNLENVPRSAKQKKHYYNQHFFTKAWNGFSFTECFDN